jgi:hypothetical protein
MVVHQVTHWSFGLPFNSTHSLDSLVDMPPNSLKNPSVGPRAKQRKKKKVGAHSLTCSTSGIGGHAIALGWD